MKTPVSPIQKIIWFQKSCYVILGLVTLSFFSFVSSTRNLNLQHTPVKTQDTGQNIQIKDYISKKALGILHYPMSVKRFYAQRTYQSIWIGRDKEIKKTWEAMLMLDCVLQFGLSHDDYHPKVLIYDKLHQIIDQPDRISEGKKIEFEVLLTDAVITLMNHLHYGKLNALYTNTVVDAGNIQSFKAENTLAHALEDKDFIATVLGVQPTSTQYILLQRYMTLIKGQYLDDCYEVPEAEVRKIAINMERLRWANISGKNYIQINIPAYTLTYHHGDSSYVFKTVVGRPGNPTPTIQSVITYFKTAPDWSVPKRIFIKELLPKAIKDKSYLENNHFSIYNLNGNYVSPNLAQLIKIKNDPDNYFARQSPGCDHALGLIAFRFPNQYNVYLHDTPEKQLFNKKIRALSQGCIRVQDAEKLATLLLKYDNSENELYSMNTAIANYKPKQFYLKDPVPLNINYLTCEMQDGLLMVYDDIYNQDDALEMALYNLTKKPVTKKPIVIKRPDINQ
ncbi:L,D-transpeptidase family protein [Pedobacter sp. MC2016-14]|uniref:L,D-transpeptidase family protein n=1 Tax=Pedobacter sp. MC2016-14 TaxID=2897327 RepID=UPI001E3D7881|nr:L,D-transpeptidase family protein [Pedobacter sp. MC2016-14]MCD0487828.1 L,D-transpeptidase family protein [Pedobacter sp. MC2016-14]